MATSSVRSPINDLTYDVLTLLQNKAKSLEAYDKYLEDAADDEEIHELLTRLRRQDEEHVRVLRDALVKCLEEEDLDDEDYEDEEEEDDEDEDFDDEEEDVEEGLDAADEGDGEAVTQPSVQGPPPRRGESTQRRN